MRVTGRPILALLLVALLAAAARGAEFDRRIPVQPGTRLDVRLYGGEVVIRGWDEDAVRVRAVHFDSDTIDLEAAGSEVRVRARTRAGAPHGIDLEIRVPSWMPLSVVGPYVDVQVSGTRADVRVETVRGDIRVTGGSGRLSLSSIEGQVVLEQARGDADLRAANNGIRVTGFEGTLRAEAVDGSLRLRQVVATRVEASAMAGDILWDGGLTADGSYHLATHSGDIDVTLPAASNATVTVHALDGHFHSAFRASDDGATRGGRLRLGRGGPRLDLESFNGVISLRPAAGGRPAARPPAQ